MNGRRFKLVDQIPVHFTEFQLVTTVENANAGGAAIDLLFIFRAFTLSVWFLVLGLLVVSIFAFGAIFRFSAGRGATVLWRAIEAAVSFGLRGDHNDMQQGNTVSGALRPSHAAALIFLTGTVCLISGTFVNSVYNSAVTGRILEVKIRSVIDGIEDFANCKVSLRQMVVLRNGAPHTHIKEFVANTECHQGEDKEPLFVDAIPDGFRYIAKNRKENLYYFVQKDLVSKKIQTPDAPDSSCNQLYMHQFYLLTSRLSHLLFKIYRLTTRSKVTFPFSPPHSGNAILVTICC